METLLLVAQQVDVGAARDVLAGDGPVEVAPATTRPEVDAALDRRAGRRLVLAGGDPALQLLVQRLWRRRELSDVPFGLVPVGSPNEVAGRLRLPADPAEAARAVRAGRPRPLDLIRSDGGGGVAVGRVQIGSSKGGGIASLLRPRGSPLHVNVDDVVLADGTARVLSVAITLADPALEVLVLGPPSGRGGTGGQPFRLVRRARGRAVTVSPRPGAEVAVEVDGRAGTLAGRRSWWVEAGAWSLLCG